MIELTGEETQEIYFEGFSSREGFVERSVKTLGVTEAFLDPRLKYLSLDQVMARLNMLAGTYLALFMASKETDRTLKYLDPKDLEAQRPLLHLKG